MTDTDDLLDEATRLADVAPVGSAAERILATPRVLRALVERVRDAENEADTQAGIAAIRTAERDSLRFELDGARAVARKDNEHLIAERDEARGKLDKVRQWSENNLGGAQNAALLAIIDGKETT